MHRVTVLYRRLGPYHRARLRAAAAHLDVTAVELSAADDTYAWARLTGPDPFRRVTLFHERDVIHEPVPEVVRRVRQALTEARPEVVAVPGWSERGALAALGWAADNGVPIVVMTESNAYDGRRAWWKEAVKRRVVGLCGAALAGGRPQADYLVRLGMRREDIFLGYDVVDNEHFWCGASAARAEADEARRRLGLPERYFLASARFVPKKNLPALVRAYARHRDEAGGEPWALVLLGDGPGRAELEALRDGLGLRDAVLLPGFKQYEELPAYYGLAGAFVHASTVEQWGLVVNEAMAAGLPVLVSRTCGCASDLAVEGRNGFTFDPGDTAALARLLGRLAQAGPDRAAMGETSRQIIQAWSPERFATGLRGAVGAALRGRGRRRPWLSRFLIRSLARR
jgi:glycosyltransferase involved in cell wall biosynthesis